jgi:hypothetical protein
MFFGAVGGFSTAKIDVRTVDIEVVWPNGLRERHSGIAANQVVRIREGQTL